MSFGRWIVLWRPRRGQALLMVAVMMPLFLSVIGLAIDGGLVLDARRELQNTADAAARVGATQVHLGAYRASGGEQVVLDRALARQVVVEYLAGRGMQLTDLEIGMGQVTVSVSREVSLSFLRVVGFDAVRIRATAPAEVRYGIEQAGP